MHMRDDMSVIFVMKMKVSMRVPANSVVNSDCRSHDVPNLFICDGSVFTTSTAVNPSLTIEAIAGCTADRICEIRRRA